MGTNEGSLLWIGCKIYDCAIFSYVKRNHCHAMLINIHVQVFCYATSLHTTVTAFAFCSWIMVVCISFTEDVCILMFLFVVFVCKKKLQLLVVSELIWHAVTKCWTVILSIIMIVCHVSDFFYSSPSIGFHFILDLLFDAVHGESLLGVIRVCYNIALNRYFLGAKSA